MNELQSNTLKTNNSSLSCSSGPTDQGSVFTRLDRFMREVFFGGGGSFLPACRGAKIKTRKEFASCQPHGKIVSRSFSFISLQMEENKDKQFSSAFAAAATVWRFDRRLNAGLQYFERMLTYVLKGFFFFCCLQRWKGKPEIKDKSSTVFPNAVIIICQRKINISRVNVRY